MKKTLLLLILFSAGIMRAGDMAILSGIRRNLVELAESSGMHSLAEVTQKADSVPQFSKYALVILRKCATSKFVVDEQLLEDTQMQIYEALKADLLRPFSAKESLRMEATLDTIFCFRDKVKGTYPMRWLILHFMLRWQRLDHTNSPCTTKFFFKGLKADIHEVQLEFEDIPQEQLQVLVDLFQKNIIPLSFWRHFSLRNLRLAAFPLFLCTVGVAILAFQRGLVGAIDHGINTALTQPVGDGGGGIVSEAIVRELGTFREAMTEVATREARAFREQAAGQTGQLTTQIAADVRQAAAHWEHAGDHFGVVTNRAEERIGARLADGYGRVEGLISRGEVLIDRAGRGPAGWLIGAPRVPAEQQPGFWARLWGGGAVPSQQAANDIERPGDAEEEEGGNDGEEEGRDEGSGGD